jgi:hypothetical protein
MSDKLGSERPGVLVSPTDLKAVEIEIDKQLDYLERASYGVDVCQKYNRSVPVIAVVVSHSDAMHALLFVRKALREALAASGVSEAPK